MKKRIAIPSPKRLSKSSRSIVLFRETAPDALYFEGEKLPRSVLETRIGKPLDFELRISEVLLEAYRQYCHEILFFHSLRGHLITPPKSVPISKLNIVNLGPLGFGLSARETIPERTILGYYWGDVSRSESVTMYSLRLWSSEIREMPERPFSIDPRGVSLAALISHFPRKEIVELADTVSKSAPLPESVKRDLNRMATANVDWDSVQFLNPGKSQGLSIPIFITPRSVKAGELLGIDYGSMYWRGRGLEPVYFDKTTQKPIPNSRDLNDVVMMLSPIANQLSNGYTDSPGTAAWPVATLKMPLRTRGRDAAEEFLTLAHSGLPLPEAIVKLIRNPVQLAMDMICKELGEVLPTSEIPIPPENEGKDLNPSAHSLSESPKAKPTKKKRGRRKKA